MDWLIDHPLPLFGAMLLLFLGCTRAGALARIHGHKLTPAERGEFDLVRSAMFTLFGLIVGFAISMAVSRYDLRKSLEESEANAIGAEYVRLDFMPAGVASKARALLVVFADQRIAYYGGGNAEELARNAADTARTMTALWSAIAPEISVHPTPVTALVASGMNDVLNAYGYTLAAFRNRLPIEVWLLLIGVAASCNFLIGFGAEKLSSWTLGILPLTASLAILLIADVEGPHNGFVRVDSTNLIDAASSMRGP